MCEKEKERDSFYLKYTFAHSNPEMSINAMMNEDVIDL
jgi:hypothetical protein